LSSEAPAVTSPHPFARRSVAAVRVSDIGNGLFLVGP
jgi:hypothetical protein